MMKVMPLTFTIVSGRLAREPGFWLMNIRLELYMTTNIRDIVAVANASADLKTWAYELEGDASAFVQGKTTKTKIT